MRVRLRRAVLVAVATALLAFAVPLGLVAGNLLAAQTRVDVERAALEAAFRIGPSFRTGDPLELPRTTSAGIGVYAVSGRLVSGRGPVRIERDAGAARSGTVVHYDTRDAVVAVVPVVANETTIGLVRGARPRRDLFLSEAALWGILFAVAAGVLLLSTVLAQRTAGRLAGPVERLAAEARSIGGPRTDARPLRSGLAEVDEVGLALQESATRIADMVERERRVAANASHQLRTPLAALRLRLEEGDVSTALVAAAIAEVDRMDATITELIQITRGTAPPGTADAAVAVGRAFGRWAPQFAAAGREFRIGCDPELPEVAVAEAVLTTVLDVLLENAFWHGAGTTALSARALGGTVAIDVIDAGNLAGDPLAIPPGDPGAGGLGLALARSAVADAGGRLILAEHGERTRFTILVDGARPAPSFSAR